MDQRLNAILEHIPHGEGIIDVGTDHAYLPIALAESGYTGNIYASDINKGPLSSARRNASEHGLEKRLEFLLADGLSGCPYDKLDTVVIAGMGGDLICNILDRAEWTMDKRYTLILQPMTKAEVLRYWLSNNEYEIQEEILVREGSIYQIIIARFGKVRLLRDAELFSGEFSLIKDSPLCSEHIELLIKRFKAAVRGLEASADIRSCGRLRLFRGIITELEEMRAKL